MKDISFALAMNKIVGQAEAEQKQQVRAQQRALKMARIRSVAFYVCVAAIGVSAVCYRGKLQSVFTSIMPKSAAQSTTGATASTLQGAAQNAATRDAVIAEVSK